jgi:uncharacterized membrane protein HdeD (DUF308 family)
VTDDLESTTAPDDSRLLTASPAEQVERHWGPLLAVGVATFLLGVALSLWPGETVVVVAFLLAIHLVLSGGTELVLALVTTSRQGAARVTAALAGAVALVVGVLLLLRPLQTFTFIGWAVGLCVVAVGAADLLEALLSRGSPHRRWQALRGILALLVGLFLLTNPDLSLGLLVVVACVWLISYGFLTIVSSLVLRSELRAGS